MTCLTRETGHLSCRTLPKRTRAGHFRRLRRALGRLAPPPSPPPAQVVRPKGIVGGVVRGRGRCALLRLRLEVGTRPIVTQKPVGGVGGLLQSILGPVWDPSNLYDLEGNLSGAWGD
jgi:hypothetical protein